MNERPDERAQSDGADGGSNPRRDLGLPGPHIGEETLNALVDRALAPAESATVRSHLDGCSACQATYVELRATRALLRALPAPLPRRSFHLGPEYLSSRDSLWTRLAGVLLPALPAMRAATIAVALLLAAVSLRNALQDPATNGVVSDIPQSALPVKQTSVAEDDSQNTAALETNQRAQTETPAALPAPTELTGTRQTTADEPPAQGAGGAAVPTATLPPFSGGDFAGPVEESEPIIADDAATDTAEEPTAGSSFKEPEDSDDAGSIDESTSDTDTASDTADEPTGSQAFEEGDAPAEDTDAVTESEAGADPEVEEATTLQIDEGDGAGNAAPAGEAESSLAMSAAPADGSPSPESTIVPTALPTATNMASATATATATSSPTPAPTATPEPASTSTPAPVTAIETVRAEGRDDWDVAQAVLAILLAVLVLALGGVALARRQSAR